ncbi:FabD/lysophospholipase-like protein [Acaromyces ingoldii]|uniref:Lysophospholipase n=1 Tax=Acaromyces ingoldii TaxID=215250 RepID=A0A316YCL0_9BASI|nr:FabD/lysophospholipase-like protein [Acaromyces ingoldii]PWN86959.1 FabD/lysophospholipase-like protein [Acaromyces ingoldii]
MLVLAPLLSVVVVLLLSPLQVASQSLANSGACPATSGLARDVGQTQTLGAGEAAYIDRRTKVVQQAWLDKLSALNLSSDAVTAMIQKDPPRIAFAMSGGGLTATLFNTGYLQGLDARNATAQARGTAGLLDLFSYIGGLSGGSWALGTLALNDWPTVQSLHDNVWQLEDGGLPAVPPRLSATDLVSPLVAALNQAGQLLSGVLTPGLSVVNVWGTLLAGHFVATSSPFTAQWSDISSTPSFQNASKPFPLVTAIDYQGAALRPAGGNATIVEFNPYEFGSWDPAIAAFANISVMGTPLTGGNAPQDGQCVLGYATAWVHLLLGAGMHRWH